MSTKISFVLRVIYAICLLGATCTHVTMLWQNGILGDYGGRNLFTRIYWTSLTFLDPLAALLLFFHPRIGLLLTVAIISSDVLHNTLIASNPWNFMYLSQVAFLTFVISTVRVAWKGAPAKHHRNVTLSI